MLRVYMLFWYTKCIFTQLPLDVDSTRFGWLWNWRRSTIVSWFYIINIGAFIVDLIVDIGLKLSNRNLFWGSILIFLTSFKTH